MGVKKEVSEVMVGYLESHQGPKEAIACGLTLLADLVIETSRIADSLERPIVKKCEHNGLDGHWLKRPCGCKESARPTIWKGVGWWNRGHGEYEPDEWQLCTHDAPLGEWCPGAGLDDE